MALSDQLTRLAARAKEGKNLPKDVDGLETAMITRHLQGTRA